MTAFAEECTRDLAAAEPVIKEAEAALNSLDKGSLGELKSFGSPAAEVVQVVSACIVLTAPGGKIPKVSSYSFSAVATLGVFFADRISAVAAAEHLSLCPMLLLTLEHILKGSVLWFTTEVQCAVCDISGRVASEQSGMMPAGSELERWQEDDGKCGRLSEVLAGI